MNAAGPRPVGVARRLVPRRLPLPVRPGAIVPRAVHAACLKGVLTKTAAQKLRLVAAINAALVAKTAAVPAILILRLTADVNALRQLRHTVRLVLLKTKLIQKPKRPVKVKEDPAVPGRPSERLGLRLRRP